MASRERYTYLRLEQCKERMGIFTLHENADVDRKIQTEMNIICDEILSSVSPISILLAGTFGNGEGSVLIQDTHVTPVADYDILIIVERNHLLTQKELNDLKKKVMARCQSGEIERNILKGCKIDIFQSTPEQFQSNAHLSVYNMINNGSIVLYGKDIRPTITLDINRMAPSACYYSLVRSIISLLQNFSKIDHVTTTPSEKDLFSLIFYCSKVYLHMGTQLTLCHNLYHPTCRKRGQRLKEQYMRFYPDLAAVSPNLPDKILLFSELTLFPDDIKKGCIDPEALWFETRQDFEIVMKYCLKSIGYTDSDNWVDISNQMSHILRANYYYHYIEHYLENRHHIKFAPITSLVNFVYQFRNAHSYLMKSHLGIKGVHLYTICPKLKLYAISPLLLFSIQNDGSIDRTLFSAFQKEFSAVYPDIKNLSLRNDVNNWALAKDMFFNALNTAKRHVTCLSVIVFLYILTEIKGELFTLDLGGSVLLI